LRHGRPDGSGVAIYRAAWRSARCTSAPYPADQGFGRRPKRPTKAEQANQCGRHPDGQQQTILLEVGDRDKDDRHPRNDVHQRQWPTGGQRQQKDDQPDETVHHIVTRVPPRPADALDCFQQRTGRTVNCLKRLKSNCRFDGNRGNNGALRPSITRPRETGGPSSRSSRCRG
jgi:hypothetical protein